MVDRLKDMIITRRRERLLDRGRGSARTSIDAVTEAAVFGIPDPRWGEAVHAVVTIGRRRDVTADGLSHTAAS